MNVLKVLKTAGHILLVEAAYLILPLVVGFIYGETDNWVSFVVPIAVALGAGLLLKFIPLKKENFYVKEGFATVGLSWLLVSLVGCLPFILSGALPNFFDAFFETVSGFTTTGATTLVEVESLPKGLLFWRSSTHLLGGMGIMVFFLAVLPKTYGNNIYLYRAESTGVKVSKIVSKMRSTALILYLIYFAMFVLQTIILIAGGEMNVFESVCYSMATAGCGGFGVTNNSLADFGTYSQVVVTIFMFLFSVNFALYFLLFIGKFRQSLFDEELLWYVGIVVVAILAITLNLLSVYGDFGTALKHAAFQVTSVSSTTGFFSANYSIWPRLSLCIIVVLMIFGGMSGSTAGGVKISRVGIVFKSASKDIRRIIKPNKVTVVRFNGKVLTNEEVRNVRVYWLLLFFFIVISTMALMLCGQDLETNLTMTISALGNVGPSYGNAFFNASCFGNLEKVILSIDMLIGRLEIFPVLIFLCPTVWRYK